MTSTLLRRRVALGVTLGCMAALLITTALLWPGLERRYHLLRLQKDPALFEELFLSEDSPRKLAAGDFLRQPAGQQALCELYIAELDRSEPSWKVTEQLKRFRGNPSQRGLIALSIDRINTILWSGAAGHSSSQMASPPANPRRRQRILESLQVLSGRTFRVSALDPLEVQIQPAEKGVAEPPRWPVASADEASLEQKSIPQVLEAARHVCFFRVCPPKVASP